MMLDGIKIKKSKAYGWRNADPSIDVDDQGRPLQSNYIVIVKINDCPIYEKNGRKYYEPKGVKQAFKLGMGGTYYGYGKTQIIHNGYGRYVLSRHDNKMTLMYSYRKTPMYFVRDGQVYVGACYSELRFEDEQK